MKFESLREGARLLLHEIKLRISHVSITALLITEWAHFEYRKPTAQSITPRFSRQNCKNRVFPLKGLKTKFITSADSCWTFKRCSVFADCLLSHFRRLTGFTRMVSFTCPHGQAKATQTLKLKSFLMNIMSSKRLPRYMNWCVQLFSFIFIVLLSW